MRQLMAALVLAAGITPAFAAMQTRPVEWKVGNESFSGMLVTTMSAPRHDPAW
jgi:hypothetical protein